MSTPYSNQFQMERFQHKESTKLMLQDYSKLEIQYISNNFYICKCLYYTTTYTNNRRFTKSLSHDEVTVSLYNIRQAIRILSNLEGIM